MIRNNVENSVLSLDQKQLGTDENEKHSQQSSHNSSYWDLEEENRQEQIMKEKNQKFLEIQETLKQEMLEQQQRQMEAENPQNNNTPKSLFLNSELFSPLLRKLCSIKTQNSINSNRDGSQLQQNGPIQKSSLFSKDNNSNTPQNSITNFNKSFFNNASRQNESFIRNSEIQNQNTFEQENKTSEVKSGQEKKHKSAFQKFLLKIKKTDLPESTSSRVQSPDSQIEKIEQQEVNFEFNNEVLQPKENVIMDGETRRVGLLHVGLIKLAEKFRYKKILKKIGSECKNFRRWRSLQKPNRSQEEIQYISRAIQGLEIFQSGNSTEFSEKMKQVFSNEQTTNALMKGIKHRFLKKREVLFKIGEVGASYFIVIQGAVNCMIPHNQDSYQQQQYPKKKSIQQYSKRELMSMEEEDYLRLIFPNLKCCFTFMPGQGFGDIALLTKSNRTATMVMKEDTHLLSLSKQAFEKIFENKQAELMQKQIEYLRNYPFFSKISSSFLIASVMKNMLIITFKNKETIYKEEDLSTYYYFINQGEVALSKEVRVYDEEFEQQTKCVEGFQVLSKSQQQNLDKSQNRRIIYAHTGENTFFGEQEIYAQKDQRNTRAVVSSNTALIYKISKEKLHNILKSRKQYQVFEDIVVQKIMRHEAQLRKFMQTKLFTSLSLLRATHFLNKTQGINEKLQVNTQIDKWEPKLTRQNLKKRGYFSQKYSQNYQKNNANNCDINNNNIQMQEDKEQINIAGLEKDYVIGQDGFYGEKQNFQQERNQFLSPQHKNGAILNGINSPSTKFYSPSYQESIHLQNFPSPKRIASPVKNELQKNQNNNITSKKKDFTDPSEFFSLPKQISKVVQAVEKMNNNQLENQQQEEFSSEKDKINKIDYTFLQHQNHKFIQKHLQSENICNYWFQEKHKENNSANGGGGFSKNNNSNQKSQLENLDLKNSYNFPTQNNNNSNYYMKSNNGLQSQSYRSPKMSISNNNNTRRGTRQNQSQFLLESQSDQQQNSPIKHFKNSEDYIENGSLGNSKNYLQIPHSSQLEQTLCAEPVKRKSSHSSIQNHIKQCQQEREREEFEQQQVALKLEQENNYKDSQKRLKNICQRLNLAKTLKYKGSEKGSQMMKNKNCFKKTSHSFQNAKGNMELAQNILKTSEQFYKNVENNVSIFQKNQKKNQNYNNNNSLIYNPLQSKKNSLIDVPMQVSNPISFRNSYQHRISQSEVNSPLLPKRNPSFHLVKQQNVQQLLKSNSEDTCLQMLQNNTKQFQQTQEKHGKKNKTYIEIQVNDSNKELFYDQMTKKNLHRKTLSSSLFVDKNNVPTRDTFQQQSQYQENFQQAPKSAKDIDQVNSHQVIPKTTQQEFENLYRYKSQDKIIKKTNIFHQSFAENFCKNQQQVEEKSPIELPVVSSSYRMIKDSITAYSSPRKFDSYHSINSGHELEFQNHKIQNKGGAYNIKIKHLQNQQLKSKLSKNHLLLMSQKSTIVNNMHKE